MNTTPKKALIIAGLVLFLAALTLVIGMRSGLIESESLTALQELIAPPDKGEASATSNPLPEYFTISLVGDCTLAGPNGNGNFACQMNGDVRYPFSGTVKYFDDDYLTIANLECVLSDSALSSDSMFRFKSPASYAAILSSGSVELVTTANNHCLDFGRRGLDDTVAALRAEGIASGADGETLLYTTDGGLKVGVFFGYMGYRVPVNTAVNAVEKLKSMGAEYIICAFHWGNEGEYRPAQAQQVLARAAIDAGADLVYGSHPHVLQPVEQYGGGLILYSLGNFSFGGNSNPPDMDTAIAQITVMRDTDGSVSMSSYELIPCRVSSNTVYNNYCPTPYSDGTESYSRCMSKLLGTYAGSNLIVDYSFMTDGEEPDADNGDSPGDDKPDDGGEDAEEPTVTPEPDNMPEAPPADTE